MPYLSAWSTFYTTAASAAAALTGLMFVVITLIFGGPRRRAQSGDGIATFSTPTVLHFSAALLASLVLSAPWRSIALPAVLVGLVGLYGVVHIAGVMHRSRQLETYGPDIEDWLCFSIIPAIGYGVLLLGATAMPATPDALFAVAAGILVLIFIGIRNSWDVVTFIAIDRAEDAER